MSYKNLRTAIITSVNTNDIEVDKPAMLRDGSSNPLTCYFAIHAIDQFPDADNTEIVTIASQALDVFTLSRQAQSSTLRSIQVGDRITAVITEDDLGGGGGGATINDSGVATDEVWSSQKVSNELANKADTSSLGTAAAADSGDFATAAQGAKADTALQSDDLTGLATETYVDSGLSAKADDASVVHDTGDETVAGVKTFSSSPVVPTPTTDMQVATKKYVDDNAGGGGGGSVVQPLGGGRARYIHQFSPDLSASYTYTGLNGSLSSIDGGLSFMLSNGLATTRLRANRLGTPPYVSDFWDRIIRGSITTRQWSTGTMTDLEWNIGWGYWGHLPTYKSLGFRNTDGVSEFLARNGNGTTEASTDIYASFSFGYQNHILGVEHTPGVNDKFYLDGSLVATHTDYIPSGANAAASSSLYGISFDGSYNTPYTTLHIGYMDIEIEEV